LKTPNSERAGSQPRSGWCNKAQGCRFGYPGKSANQAVATLTGLRLMNDS